MRFKQGSIMTRKSLQVGHEMRLRVREEHFRLRGSTFVERHRGGKECHVCVHLEKRAMLGTSFSITRGWHGRVS